MSYHRIGAIKTTGDFRDVLRGLNLDLPCDDEPLSAVESSPLAQSLEIGGFTVGNRWCVHPMEGWDGTPGGRPSEETLRRWQHFGESGCKLIWGGEAVAVERAGRANPNQLFYRPENVDGLRTLLETCRAAHRDRFGTDDDLLVGLQLTHSGRFCRPNRKDTPEPRIVYHHPVLDHRVGIDSGDDSRVFTDDEIQRLIDRYVEAARSAAKAGYQFVDVKSCHGYLGHEFLSAFTRPGSFGGDFEGRTRFLREIVTGIQAECPELMIGVRLSIFDFPPFHPDASRAAGGKLGPGIPEEHLAEDYPGFGCNRTNPLEIDLTEPIELIRLLHDDCGVRLFNLSAGSPYYNPHMQRPAFYPPSDGYQPPEDPLVGCVRQISAVREVKQAVPKAMLVGTAYTYFQEYLPHVAQAVLRAGWVDSIGIGRLVLSDWDLPARVLAGEDYRAAKKICRTFSDCTTAPRNGMISGCFPLDPYYKERPEAKELKRIKSRTSGS